MRLVRSKHYMPGNKLCKKRGGETRIVRNKRKIEWVAMSLTFYSNPLESCAHCSGSLNLKHRTADFDEIGL